MITEPIRSGKTTREDRPRRRGSCSAFLYAGILFLLPVIPFPLSAQAQKKTPKTPVSIIFDTDIGPDYDDIGAIALLHVMANKDECKILATVASNQYPRIAAVLSVMNTYFNRPGIPVGVVRGNAVDIGCRQKWDSLIVERYPHTLNTNDQAGDALSLYRKILAAQPDQSVTIVTVGFLTNMANLLRSGPDKFSSLSGAELIKRKVKLLVSMAGRFDEPSGAGVKPGTGADTGHSVDKGPGAGASVRLGSFKEFNVVRDAASSKITFDNWPGPILFSGFEIGSKIFTGLPLINNDRISHSPVKDVFARSIPMDPNDKNGRMSWDETAVLVAVRGYQEYFDAVPGKVICNADGSTGWDEEGLRQAAGTPDHYLVQKISISEMEKIINELMMGQPQR